MCTYVSLHNVSVSFTFLMCAPYLKNHRSNFGKLNYFLGKQAADEGHDTTYPSIDFCRDPEAICSSEEHKELKWIGKFQNILLLKTLISCLALFHGCCMLFLARYIHGKVQSSLV